MPEVAKKSHKKMWISLIAAVVLLIIIVSSSSGSASKTSASAASNTAATSTASGASTSVAPSTSAAPSVPHLGATLTVTDMNNHPFSVQLTQVQDPAVASDSFDTASPGKRLVAAYFSLTNKGSSTIQDDANSNATVVGSDNQSYQPNFDTVNGCTNFDAGQYTLTPGSTSSGCVVFSIPNSVTVAKVQFQPTSFSGTVAEWVVS